MDIQEQAFRNSRVIESNKFLENLASNPDFIQWKEDFVEKRLESILESIKTADRSVDGWKDKVCDAVIAYQEAKLTYETVFGMAKMSSEVARKNLQSLSQAPEQSS